MTKITSRDGVEIPAKGISYDIITNFMTTKDVVTIVLKDLLVGVNLVIADGKTQAQGDTLASFAVQMGFRSEAEIIAAHPDVPLNASWSLIGIWKAILDGGRDSKAQATMTGQPVTGNFPDAQGFNASGQKGQLAWLLQCAEKSGKTNLVNAVEKAVLDLFGADRAQASVTIDNLQGAFDMFGVNRAYPVRTPVQEHLSDEKVDEPF